MAEKKLKRVQQCQSWGIQIGPDYMEKTAYKVGKYRICGWCRAKLLQHGHIELDGRRPVLGKGIVCRWLYPDGSVKQVRVVAVKEPEPDVIFVPLNQPLPEGLLIEEENDDQPEVRQD